MRATAAPSRRRRGESDRQGSRRRHGAAAASRTVFSRPTPAAPPRNVGPSAAPATPRRGRTRPETQAGGWPTLRYYNSDTGPGGAVVEQKTAGKICDEFKTPARMIEATKDCMRTCDAATNAGCDADETAFLDTWRAEPKAARNAESARLMELLTVAAQKRMQKELKLLAKIQKLPASDEL